MRERRSSRIVTLLFEGYLSEEDEDEDAAGAGVEAAGVAGVLAALVDEAGLLSEDLLSLALGFGFP